jgi:salicylate 5-hydroxylase small subunit
MDTMDHVVAQPVLPAATVTRSLRVDGALYGELCALHADAAAALDERRLKDWVEFFTEEGLYVLQPRENFDRGLPLATIRLEGRGMLLDRIHAVEHTLYHQPYYQRHVIGPLRVVSVDETGWQVQASYAVFRTRRHALTELFNVGRSLDRVVREAGVLKFASRHLVFDSELVPNSIIDPI